MDMMIRRAMMPNDNYIKNGLVLWMDGIDKGNVSGTWVDKAKGHVFTNVNGMTNGSNYVELSSASQQYFQNDTFNNIKPEVGTIEVAIDSYSAATIVYMPNTDGIAFGIRSNGEQILWRGSDENYGSVLPFVFGEKLFSIRWGHAVVDGSNRFFNDQSNWLGASGNYNYIGRRNYGANNFYNGKIYSIRIYERQLTAAEMLHNQRIDNKRFHLGLTI